jgi:hypothetical protein
MKTLKRALGVHLETSPKEVVQSYGDWIIDHLNFQRDTTLLTYLYDRMLQTPQGTMLQVNEWITEYLASDWEVYHAVFMFHHIPGSPQEKMRQMHKDISSVYGTLASRVVRKPTSAKFAHLLPKAVFFPDVPCLKREKQPLRDVKVNDGIHVHGIILVPRKNRLKGPLDEHFHQKKKVYVRGNIARIHLRPITSEELFVVDYAGKAIKRRRFSYDDILILPKTSNELRPQMSEPIAGADREIKDIMSAHNVSLETAQGLCRTTLQKPRRSG